MFYDIFHISWRTTFVLAFNELEIIRKSAFQKLDFLSIQGELDKSGICSILHGIYSKLCVRYCIEKLGWYLGYANRQGILDVQQF